jgi:hypothetical protein
LDATQTRSLLAKQARSSQFFANASAAWRGAKVASGGSAAMLATTPTSLTLAEPLYQQINESWCGPTTVAMIAAYLHVGWGGTVANQENAAASLLRTTMADGTAWYGPDNVPNYPGSSWYPVHDLLNYQMYRNGRSSWYVVNPLPGSPSSTDQANFKANLVTDINDGFPEADDQYSVPGYNIGYQPNNQTLYHWWSARGYTGSGGTTYFNDPAAWSQGRMSYAQTTGGQHTVVVALGGRGYIW